MGKIESEPRTEVTVREWIAAHLDELGFDLVRSGGAFPDMTLRNQEGQEVEAEVEYKSASFVAHKHDPNGCDLVICWIHNAILPLPVLELSTKKYYKPNERGTAEVVRVHDKLDKKVVRRAVKQHAQKELDEFYLRYADYLRAMDSWLDIVAPAKHDLDQATTELLHILEENDVLASYLLC